MIIEYLTVILVIITGFYAWVTFKILRANEKVVEVMCEQAESVTRPYITVNPFLEPDNPIFYLRISNTGKTAANNLKLTIDKPFHKFGEKTEKKNIATFAAFDEIIESFSPGEEMTFSLAQYFVLFGKDADKKFLPQNFTITAEYSYANKTVKEMTKIDLSAYYGSDLPQDPYIRKLKNLIEAIESIAVSISEKKKLKEKTFPKGGDKVIGCKR